MLLMEQLLYLCYFSYGNQELTKKQWALQSTVKVEKFLTQLKKHFDTEVGKLKNQFYENKIDAELFEDLQNTFYGIGFNRTFFDNNDLYDKLMYSPIAHDTVVEIFVEEKLVLLKADDHNDEISMKAKKIISEHNIIGHYKFIECAHDEEIENVD